MDPHSTDLPPHHRTSMVTRLFIFAFCIVSLGGYRLQLAGIDPTQSYQGFSASYLLYAVDIVCICWAVFIFLTNCDAFIRVLRTSLPLTLLPLLALASSVISVSPELTFLESVKYISAFIVPIAAVILWYSGRYSQFSYDILKIILYLSIFTIFFFPKYGVHSSFDFFQATHAGSWRGIFGHRTDFGYCCAILTGLSFSKVVYRKKISDFFVLCASVFCLYMAGSGGAYIVAIASTVVTLFYFTMRNELNSLKFSIVVILVSIIIFVTFILFTPEYLLSLIGEESSFTGRIPLWSYIIENVTINHVYGLGYIAGFDLVAGPSAQLAGFNVPNSQGAYMEALIAFGVFGPLLIFSITIRHFIIMIRLYADDKLAKNVKFTCFCISVIAFVLLLTSTVVESYILQTNKILVGLLLILTTEISVFSGNLIIAPSKRNFQITDGQGRLI